MGKCDNDIDSCCFRYGHIAEFKYCPICGKPLAPTNTSLYRVYKYTSDRLVDINTYTGSIPDVLARIAASNHEYVVELIDSRDLFSISPERDPMRDTYVITLKPNSKHSLSNLREHIQKELRDFRIADSDVNTIKLRRTAQ